MNDSPAWEPPAGPLNGVTVVDLTRALAGPYCTMVLADLGARVVKVERPRVGDDARHIGPFINGVSAYFASINRGKESIALDLRDGADRATFESLLAEADVVVENFRGGTFAELGYDWDTLQARFPKLIYAAVSGFGHTGPYASRPAYDMVVQGMGGVMSITGHEGGEPTRVGTSIGDIVGGLFCAIGVVSSLLHRARTDETTKVDVSMLDCQVAILENAIARYMATGIAPGPIGAHHPSIAPFGAFEAADGWLVIAAGNDSLFRRLSEVVGLPQLPTDARFADNRSRTEHRTELQHALESALRGGPVHTWLDRLAEAEIPCGPINDVGQVLADPQVRARNMVVPVEDDRLAGFEVAGNPIKLSAFPDPTTRGPVPDLET
jgi:CoA:oxalate CoA-transferase